MKSYFLSVRPFNHEGYEIEGVMDFLKIRLFIV